MRNALPAVLALVVLQLAPAHALERNRCIHRDASFAAFLARFKSDAGFREGRIVVPLRYRERGPGEASTKFLSRAQVKIYGASLIVADPAASNTGDPETDVCEEAPKVTGSAATFLQYTCHSDLHAETFHFVRKRGCWFLKELETVGG